MLAPITRFFERVTDPVLMPVRRSSRPFASGSGAIDLSPLVVFVGIFVIRALL